jgi:hypothetical protein
VLIPECMSSGMPISVQIISLLDNMLLSILGTCNLTCFEHKYSFKHMVNFWTVNMYVNMGWHLYRTQTLHLL